MGNWFSWAAPTSEATWTHTEIYRASSQAGAYSLLTTQVLDVNNPDTTYFDESGGSTNWYKVRFKNSTGPAYSGYSDPIQGSSVTLAYTTPSKVASMLQFRNSQNLSQFDGTTKPNIWEVIEMIQHAEDEVDNLTQHAWRERYAYDMNDTNDFEIHDLSYDYKYLTGIPIHLQHRHVRQIDTAKGDQILIWNGSGYEDWVTLRTEGRANDYWLDYRAGTLWLRTYIYRQRPRGVQIRYRYGEQTVPRDIEKACSALVAAQACMSDDRSNMLPEGGDNIHQETKQERFENKATAILSRYKEFQMLV